MHKKLYKPYTNFMGTHMIVLVQSVIRKSVILAFDMYKYNTSMGCTYINVARLPVSNELSHDVSNTLQKKKSSASKP